ncbi:uncharacterized protein Z520_01705 [Fonsecaea multimorphosa CBS 102226]|uniref:Lipocalin-like domain-containing protein n=1 Tax=Fonsecaea multimorphosa CBS 102226 TaxID=1442371 RepID=A0A0D2KB44_9EURO|nr:uncharacterized protein Z520_01705 [Fonsecaea multimorphosa CBS 102226]KIY03238.1 hypothetical protein Z520_01705 [Fonsecaea multimorphosa CBS 102226]OAL30477.1 hypothetical protein AYO22_01675 [Fonsecaea multimorphosa]
MAAGSPGSIRSQLIGAWELIEYVAYLPNDESNKFYPMGQDAKGIIMYTPDGYMSAQLQTPGQKPFGDRSGSKAGSDADWATVGRNYVAYTGAFYLDERGDDKGRPILMHNMRNSNLPYLVGDIQRRIMRFVDESDGKYLVLSLDDPLKFDGEDRLIRVRWRRLPLNQASTPP